jgi:hypothetical protein
MSPKKLIESEAFAGSAAADPKSPKKLAASVVAAGLGASAANESKSPSDTFAAGGAASREGTESNENPVSMAVDAVCIGAGSDFCGLQAEVERNKHTKAVRQEN